MSFREDYIAESADRLARLFNPAAAAHIAVDLQKGYCLPPLPLHRLTPHSENFYKSAGRILAGIADLSKSFDAAGIANTLIRHDQVFDADYFVDALNKPYDRHAICRLREFAEQAAEICISLPNAKIVDKWGPSAFDETPLEDELKQKGISLVLLTGGYRDECLAMSAIDAVDRNFDTFIIDDCVLSSVRSVTKRYLENFCRRVAEENVHVVTSDHVRSLLQPHPELIAV